MVVRIGDEIKHGGFRGTVTMICPGYVKVWGCNRNKPYDPSQGDKFFSREFSPERLVWTGKNQGGFGIFSPTVKVT